MRGAFGKKVAHSFQDNAALASWDPPLGTLTKHATFRQQRTSWNFQHQKKKSSASVLCVLEIQKKKIVTNSEGQNE